MLKRLLLIRVLACCASFCLYTTLRAGPVPTNKPTAYPAWWFERDVIPRLPASANNPAPVWPTDYPPADDYAVANLGQLKYIAIKAAAELDDKLPPLGAGTTVHAWLNVWQAPPALGVTRDDYTAVNLGQVKAVAKPFYDRLAELGYTGQPLLPGQTYPWTSVGADDYALVNTGQIKHVFSFDLTISDIPETWKIANAGKFAIWSPPIVTNVIENQTISRTVYLRNDTSTAVNYSVALTGNTYPEYTFVDSLTGGVTYDWEEIGTTGTLLADISSHDDASQQATLTQFSFPFYGDNYSSLFVSSNGLIGLGVNSTSYSNSTLPNISAPRPIIAPFWDDLNTGVEGDIYFFQDSTHAVVQYERIQRYGGTDTYTFQVVLYADGRIKFRYKTLGATLDSATVGLQNGTGLNGLQMASNQPYLANGLAIDVSPFITFLSASPATGTIPPFTTLALNTTINAIGLPAGSYAPTFTTTHNSIGGTVPIVTNINLKVAPLDTDGDGLPNSWEIKYFSSPTTADPAIDGDYDGLTNLEEYQYGTDPTQPDTDGDGLNDGWEIQYGWSALVNNLSDGSASNDPNADAEQDGLTNSQEEQIGTNPLSADTDGDGFSDLLEEQSGTSGTSGTSKPGGAGSSPNDPPIVTVSVTFGDHSGSHSEKYRVILEPLVSDPNGSKRFRTNQNYGQTQTSTFNLPAGARYRVTLAHVASDPIYQGTPKPDYDYTLNFAINNAASNIALVMEDSEGILGQHDESETFFAAGKSAILNVGWLASLADVTTPTNQRRTKIGVGETGIITLRPFALAAPTWTVEGTTQTSTFAIDPNQNTATFYAGLRASSPVVKAVSGGKTFSLNYSVVEPSGESAVKDSEMPEMPFVAGRQGAGMNLVVTMLPQDVSFSNLDLLEIDKGTRNVTGFFSDYPATDLKHDPNPDWVELKSKNDTTDQAALAGYGTASTWRAGGFEWDIEVRWRVRNKETGQGVALPANRIQIFTMHDNTGRTTISKLGQSVTRTP